MYTYEMIGVADENGKEYECKYGTYMKDIGFRFTENITPVVRKSGWRGFINQLFHENLWKLKPETKQMTLADLEKELGYKVEIVDSEPKDKPVSQKSKYYNLEADLMKFLGLGDTD